jgi:uncharacterized membrane protein YdjX (TVP38/TMEM64 family)
MIRVVALVAALVAAFLAFWVFDLVDQDDVENFVDDFGASAGPAYVVVAALLGAALVPGPLLAAGSGVLFGAAWGSIVTITSAVLSAVIALRIGRATGEPHARLERLAALAERHGTLAVIFQRLVPGMPDAPASYAFGVLKVRTWQIALGTLVGSAPRSFSYTSIGASLDDPGSTLAIVGWAGVVITGLVGAGLALRYRLRSSARRDAAAGTGPRPEASERPSTEP